MKLFSAIFTWCVLLTVMTGSIVAARTLSARTDFVIVDPWQGSYVPLDSSILLSNDGQEISTVSIKFKSGYVVGDTLTVNAAIAAFNGISASFNGTTGLLTLRAVGAGATATQFQTVLRNVNYNLDLSAFTTNPSAFAQNTLKILEIVVFESGAELNLGTESDPDFHFYEFVSAGASWLTAKSTASGLYYYGIQGYLATIRSSVENNFLRSKAGASTQGWLGGSDSSDQGFGASEDNWKWVTGPDAGVSIPGSATAVGLRQLSPYANWNDGEPNNLGPEHYLQMVTTDRWNDLSNIANLGYFVEYGGLPASSSARNIIRIQLLYPNAIERALIF